MISAGAVCALVLLARRHENGRLLLALRSTWTAKLALLLGLGWLFLDGREWWQALFEAKSAEELLEKISAFTWFLLNILVLYILYFDLTELREKGWVFF